MVAPPSLELTPVKAGRVHWSSADGGTRPPPLQLMTYDVRVTLYLVELSAS